MERQLLIVYSETASCPSHLGAQPPPLPPPKKIKQIKINIVKVKRFKMIKKYIVEVRLNYSLTF